MNNIKSITTKIFILFLCTFSITLSAAEDVEILNFTEFENRIKANNDETIIYNFWATWCKPCVEELPYFEQINAEYKDSGIKVVFVSLDFKSQYERKLLPFLDKNQLKAEVLLLDAPDYNSWINKISEKWSGAIPATLIVNNKTGRWDFYEKSFNYDELKKVINP